MADGMTARQRKAEERRQNAELKQRILDNVKRDEFNRGRIEGLRMAEEIVRGWTLRIGGQLEGSLANLKLEEGTGLQDLADAIRSEREKLEGQQ